MAHLHSVYDTDTHFQIDGVTRAVKNASSTKTMLVQYDHNSERFTFEIPRMIDGHDMSTCNVVQVHYINIEAANKSNKNAGIYEVDDLQISPDSDDVVICSWLISANATQYVGNLSFVVRFVCSTDGAVDYAWNTAVHSGVSVSSGIYNSDVVVEEYADILEQWRNELVGISDIIQFTSSDLDGGVNVIKVSLTNGENKTFTVKNGSKGSPGTDGTSVSVETVTESAEDGGSNVVIFSDGNKMTIKNGSKGEPGETPDTSVFAQKTDIAQTVYSAFSNSATIYVKIADFGAWGTGAWYQKAFSMLISSRAGELVWVSVAADDSNTNTKAFRLINTHTKINNLYYSASESALYCRLAAWSNNLCAHILTNINGDYVPTIAQASALPSDAVEINIVEFGVSGNGTQVGDSSVNLLLGGKADRPTYNGNNMALSSDIPATETWTFELEDGSTVTKAVCIG